DETPRLNLAVVWSFLPSLYPQYKTQGLKLLSKIWPIIGVLASLCIILFSLGLATFPGEWVENHLPQMRLHDLLFVGAVDRVNGKPRSPFSSRLVLTDESFVDPDKLEKISVSQSFRGRDLRDAVFNGAD